jgi:hypothetical protein
MGSDEIYLEWFLSSKWIRSAEKEIIERFNLKPPEGYPNYPSYCFVKKNSNRYFRKHLGFTFQWDTPLGVTRITILDPKKLFLFRLKYGI